MIANTKGIAVKNIATNNVTITLRLCFITVISDDQSNLGIFRLMHIPRKPEKTHEMIGTTTMNIISKTLSSSVNALATVVKTIPGKEITGDISAFPQNTFIASIGVDFSSQIVLPSREMLGAVTSFMVQHKARLEPIASPIKLLEASGKIKGIYSLIRSPLAIIPIPRNTDIIVLRPEFITYAGILKK